jgi:menaquinone-dependent protoporphyrinogen oxidase
MNSPEHRPRVLVSAASGHGSTTEIARVIGGTLSDNGIAVDIVPPEAVDSVEDYDAVILGSAVYAGRWLGPILPVPGRVHVGDRHRHVW